MITASHTLLLQLDGKLPNIALMRLATHLRAKGERIAFAHVGNIPALEDVLRIPSSSVYASLIFERTRPVADHLKKLRPEAVVGGTGWDLATTLESIGVTALHQDYSIYPEYIPSIGFTQRGCRLRCEFCVVPQKEGAMRGESTIADIWRGGDAAREIVLLDNDFFGQPNWRDRIAELRDGKFKVSLCQGINARFLNEETAEALASIDYRALDMKAKRIYTAWDNTRDEERLFRGLSLLTARGINPKHLMVYMLIGHGESAEDREYRRKKLRDFGCLPYPMCFTRGSEISGFQRWVFSGHDMKTSWADWVDAKYQGREINRRLRVLEEGDE